MHMSFELLKKIYIQREVLQQRETTQIIIYMNDITTNYWFILKVCTYDYLWKKLYI